MTIKLSIIIPIYNSQKYLKNCFDSILNQINRSQKNIEIILINDASTDNSKKICKIYKNKFNFINFIDNKKNLGVSVSRNKGIKKSKGEYILFLDSDDQLSATSINYMIKKFTTNQNIDYYFVKSRLIGKKNIDHNEVFIKNFKNKSFYSYIKNINNFRATCWNFIIKKDFILKNKIYFDNIRVFEDQIFVTKVLSSSNNFQILTAPIYERRIHEPYSLSSVTGYMIVISTIKILISLLHILIKNKKKNKKFDKFLFSRIDFAINQLLLNITICNNNQIKQSIHYINFLRKIYIKCLHSKNKSSYKFLKKIKILISSNYFYKFRDTKILFLKEFTKKFKNEKIIIFCGGSYAKISLKLIRSFKIKVLYVIDSNKNFLNKHIENQVIKDIHYLKKNIKLNIGNSILICNQNYADFINIREDLVRIGIKKNNVYHFKI